MNDFQEQKVSIGIKIIAILTWLADAFLIFGLISFLALKDTINKTGSGLAFETFKKLTPAITIILLFVITIQVISLILIWRKNKIGVFIYFGMTLINLITAFVKNGSNIKGIITNLLLPCLMAFFIYQQRELFGFKVNNDSY
ncbi:hypothetical protein SAMN02745163_03911 [Clostridium cavendishii DSM 21758]|uniref:Uncharacterized protein n=1 Tax=Clostridium cavendishii DSM 21758 TaxID=1121302 RepID=A0A1M6SXD0_9CLOT|nr:hypothetical protein [Clostridium cavendishii]SHK49385.1 hypothetical protein SAMN02745163_03911 [Clostridium cavendishii DSM 21758]